MTSRRFLALATAVSFALTACGSDAAGTPGSAADGPAESAPSSAAGEPSATADDGIEVRPASIELSPSLDVVGSELPPLEDPGDDPAVGLAAPVVTGQQFDGSDITIGGPTEGPTMLVFLAHWCPHCNDEIPEIIKLRDAGDLPADLDIIGVSTAVAADRDNYPPSEWIVAKDWTWPVMADSAEMLAIQAFGGTSFPFTVLLDADGNVLARNSGSSSADQILDWINTNITT